jgi:DNA polymerase-3 subunit delta
VSLINPEDLDKELDSGIVHPVYLLYGPEEYLIRQALSQLKKRVLNPETLAFNFAAFSGASASVGNILQALGTLPLLSSYRLVLVEQVQDMTAEDRSTLVSYLNQPHPSSSLVLVASDLDRRTGFYRSLKEKACVVDFPRLKGYGLARWAEHYVKSGGFRITSATLKRVIELVGSDLQALASEFDKLMLYSRGEDTISDEAVDNLVHKSRQHGIFELTDAVGRQDLPAALKTTGNLIESGEPPLVIVTMLARHMRQVLMAKELLDQGRKLNDISRRAKIPGFLMEEFVRQTRRFDPALARKMYHQLAKADLRLKSSGTQPRLVLESLIYSLAGKS